MGCIVTLEDRSPITSCQLANCVYALGTQIVQLNAGDHFALLVEMAVPDGNDGWWPNHFVTHC
jgi:hypothetical protein